MTAVRKVGSPMAEFYEFFAGGGMARAGTFDVESCKNKVSFHRLERQELKPNLSILYENDNGKG